jgi:spermidine synthase
MRRFSVLLGSAAPAVAAALVACFIGLGFGSYVFGRLAPRLASPLRAFAWLEIATGAFAVVVDSVLVAAPPAFARLYEVSGGSPAILLTLELLAAVAVVLLPATCMGGTLPVLAQFLAAKARALGVRAGGLYAVNTLGAACGALAVPALLLPCFGARGALAALVALNLSIGAIAFALATKSIPPVAEPEPPPEVPGPQHRESRPGKALLLFAFVSGLITLALEALATRMFAQVHENSIYSFATVLAVFLAGLALGATLARAALKRAVAAQTLIVFGWAGAGLWVALLPTLFVRITGLDYITGGDLLAHEGQLAVLAIAALFAPTVLLGLALPALMEKAGERGIAGGPAAGGMLAANTAGAACGPLLALFVLAPALGLWTAVSVTGLAALAAATFTAHWTGRAPKRVLALAFAGAMAGLAASPPGSLPRMKVSGTDRVLDIRDGAFGTVGVIEREGHRRLKLNNFYLLGGSASTGDERLQGHLPLLLHGRPERVAFLGLGTGISLSAVHFHPVRVVEALELVPEVVSSARAWFTEANLGVLTDPRVHVRAEDARSYLRATRDRFDVVVGDLVVPWRRGEASLYTRESFEAVRGTLAPGGLYCQWIPLYQLSESEFDSIAASFLDVFPRTTLWRGDFSAAQPGVALVGHTDSRGLDASVADARVRSLGSAPDPANPYLSHPAGLWLYFVGSLDPSEKRFRLAPRNRDESPWIELAGPGLHLRAAEGRRAALVGRLLKERLDQWVALPLVGTAAGSVDEAHLAWRSVGAQLFEAALLSFEGNNEAADQLGFGAVARLPPELQIAVTGRTILRE